MKESTQIRSANGGKLSRSRNRVTAARCHVCVDIAAANGAQYSYVDQSCREFGLQGAVAGCAGASQQPNAGQRGAECVTAGYVRVTHYVHFGASWWHMPLAGHATARAGVYVELMWTWSCRAHGVQRSYMNTWMRLPH